MIESALAAALDFTWLGLILGISFIEAPLKFRAPGVTIPLGLGIGRIVFRAVNRVEIALCALIAVAAIAGIRQPAALILAALAVVVLIVQLAFVRPRLNRRSDRVLRGDETGDSERSGGHFSYVALEVAKAIVLIGLGAALLVSAT